MEAIGEVEEERQCHDEHDNEEDFHSATLDVDTMRTGNGRATDCDLNQVRVYSVRSLNFTHFSAPGHPVHPAFISQLDKQRGKRSDCISFHIQGGCRQDLAEAADR
ncbi:hypothetical protein GCM10009713_24780 [Brevibacterium celere]